MMRTAFAVACCALAANGEGVTLSTFDGTKGTTQKWEELNDPVMGGRSTGTFAIQNGVGVFNGSVVDVPSLKAPGFIKVQGRGDVPDASATIGGALVLTVRTTTPEYKGFRVSFASGSVNANFACAGGGTLPLSRGCFKAKFSVPSGSKFSDVRIPFTDFSDKWSPATGEHTEECSKDKDVCPTAKELGKIQDIEIWAEGALGNVHLEVQSITAEPAAMLSNTADTCSLYKIQDGTCGQSDLDCKYEKYAKAFEKGLTDGTCADHGCTVKTGTKSISPPVVGTVTVTEYSCNKTVGDTKSAAGDSVDLATFGGAVDRDWHAECDPVMGGQSVANWKVNSASNGRNVSTGEFSGEVKIVPSLKAPGFCIALTSSPILAAKYPDASGTDGIALGLDNHGPVTNFKAAFCASRNPYTCQFKSFKADFNTTVGKAEAFIPWTRFSDKWSSTTGEPTAKSPPSANDLKEITQLQLWVEGLAGKFDVEIMYVRARKA